MSDLRDPRWMYLKAALFVAIGFVSAFLLWLDNPTWRTAILLCLCVWAFSRAYYFAFYVIQHYIDPRFRFAGLFAFARWWLSKPKR